jgi:hypothetical protein
MERAPSPVDTGHSRGAPGCRSHDAGSAGPIGSATTAGAHRSRCEMRMRIAQMTLDTLWDPPYRERTNLQHMSKF